MKRALLVVLLLASPAAAQVSTSGNPYTPYVNLANRGPVYFRSYSSLDRLNVGHQYRATPSAYYAMSAASSTIANPIRPAAGFQYYPNYPSLNSPSSGLGSPLYSASIVKQPLPFTAPQPVENSCDPYLDDDGCLSEIAGW